MLVILIALNFIAGTARARVDLTQEKAFTLLLRQVQARARRAGDEVKRDQNDQHHHDAGGRVENCLK